MKSLASLLSGTPSRVAANPTRRDMSRADETFIDGFPPHNVGEDVHRRNHAEKQSIDPQTTERLKAMAGITDIIDEATRNYLLLPEQERPLHKQKAITSLSRNLQDAGAPENVCAAAETLLNNALTRAEERSAAGKASFRL